MVEIFVTADQQKWIVVAQSVETYFASESAARTFAIEQEGMLREMARENDYITAVRAANRQIWEGINALQALQKEWIALDYGNTLDDGSGANAGITRAQVDAVVNTSANALEALLNQGHSTNMARLL